MIAPRIIRAAGAFMMLLAAWPVAAGMFGRLQGYVTATVAGDRVDSTINASYIADVIICTVSCRYVLDTNQAIQWSRTGDVMASHWASTQSSSYRNTISAPAAAGECYFATGNATYTFLQGQVVSGISLPFTPYELDRKDWTSTSVCRPGSGGSGGQTISQLCPLILDLNGDGFDTTGLSDAVHFWDMDHDGIAEASGWLAAGDDAFLWLDLNGDHAVAPHELFGSAMFQEDGAYYRNGFQALATYDSPLFGGNNDGSIDGNDGIWDDLRLWLDRNHDAVSQPTEISPLPRHGIVRLSLERVHDHSVDPAGNSLMLIGSYEKRAHGHTTNDLPLADIAFAFAQ